MFSYISKPISKFIDDDCPTMAAALAYYTIFSLPSLLLIIISVAGLVLGRQAVQGAMRQQVQQAVGPAAAGQVQTMVQHANQHSAGILGAVTGIVALIFGATTAFAQLQTALNRVWEVKPDPHASGIKSFIGKRVLSFGMILALALLLLVSLVASTVLLSFGKAAGAMLPSFLSGWFFEALNWVVSFVVIALLFAAVFKYLPDANLQWRDVKVGAAITALLFVAGKFGLGYYLAHSNVAGGYGAAGSVILILLWTYYASMIVLLGAEFTQVWARAHGRAVEPEPGAVKVKTEEREIRGGEGQRAA